MNYLKPLVMLLALGLASSPIMAQERESLEVLRNTTLNLINALVESGVITREKADALIKDAEQKATASTAQSDKAGSQVKDTTVHVPYVPETVKNEMRDQIKAEVMAQAQAEHWASPGALPSWLDRISFSGDVRLRYQFDNLAANNTAPSIYDVSQLNNNPVGAINSGPITTRNAKLADSGLTAGNTQDDESKFRVRARFGLDARVSDAVSANIRLATGDSASSTSTNQTLGNGFNKYSVYVDRAYLRYQPTAWLDMQGGRIANPWQSSDLIWDEDLNFEGFAATFKRPPDMTFSPFLTLGAFPISPKNNANDPDSKTLFGAQLGAAWNISSTTSLRTAVAYYDFENFEGHQESDDKLQDNGFGVLVPMSGVSYGASQYPDSIRQHGNTLVRINAPLDQNGATIWGLAAKFRPVHVNLGLDLANYDPIHFVWAFDYVKNMAFNRDEIQRRTGLTLNDGKSIGYQLKFLLGMPEVRHRDDWNASISYRYLGSDAVPDAYTDSDFGLGGTNAKGFTLGGTYGLEDGLMLGVRYLSAKSIESTTTLLGSDKFDVNTLQIDLGVRF